MASWIAKIKKTAAVCLASLLSAAMCLGCSNSGQPAALVQQADIITQKQLSSDKTPITVLVKYAFSINTFEKLVEEKFTQIDLIQVGNFTSDRGLVEYARRMEHDDLPDMVMTWPLNVGEEYWDDRLLDLSGMTFTSRYNTSMLNQIASNGKLYYLPGPAQVRGIVYNKTLFEENGWQVPNSFDEFVSLCQEIEASGIRSLQLGFSNSEVLDTAFIGYSYGACYSKPQDAQKIADYNAGNGSFADQFGPALETFQYMIDAGIWKPSDLSVSYSDREHMLFNRKCAMVEDSVLIARMGKQFNGCTDEFALMPFFNPGDNGEWARLYMVCYIGLNKHLAEPANKERYDLVLEIMDYISTPEGQEALVADTGAMYSSVKGVPAPNIPEIDELRTTLEEGRYAIFPELKNAQGALREGLAGMLEGRLTPDDVVRMVDEQNSKAASGPGETVIGSATEDFSLIETGNWITDIMRTKSGANFALFLDNGKDGKYNGKGVSGRLYQGTQTESDLIRILPDLKHGEKGILQTVTMTGANLINTLEHSIPVDNDIKGWFYYFSGLKMEYAPTAEPGQRIKSITDMDGNPLDPQRRYTIAVMDETVPDAYIESAANFDITILNMLTEHLQSVESISPSHDGRFTVAG